MLDLYEKYYADQTEFANQAKEAKLKYLSEEKEYLETVANAAASLLDDKLDGLEDDKDKARKIYDDQIAGIEDTIKAREKEKDAIQIKIDALKDEGDELDRKTSSMQSKINRKHLPPWNVPKTSGTSCSTKTGRWFGLLTTLPSKKLTRI